MRDQRKFWSELDDNLCTTRDDKNQKLDIFSVEYYEKVQSSFDVVAEKFVSYDNLMNFPSNFTSFVGFFVFFWHFKLEL